MLVLSREEGYAIQVGGTLLTVKEIQADTVSIEVEGTETVTHTLKKNESFRIEDEDSTIVIVELRRFNSGKKVRLGVEAPANIPVHRKEVYDAIKRNESL